MLGRNKLLVLILLTAVFGSTALVQRVERNRKLASKPTKRKPNIVLLLADDMGYTDPGFMKDYYGIQGRRVSTPVLDQLASEGLRLLDAHSGSPVCAPSRCTLMTGLHSGHCPIRENSEIQSISSINVTWASMLRDQAGYRTALFGKWGLGYMRQHASPVEKGFDTFLGQLSQENCHNYYPYVMLWNNSKVFIDENENASPTGCGGILSLRECRWSGDIFTKHALDFLENHVESGDTRPFALFVSHTIPHAGGVGTNAEYGSPIPELDTYHISQYIQSWGLPKVQYGAAVMAFDEQAGKILDALERLNLVQDTLVIFTSDNGASSEAGHNYKFFNSSGPLRGFKRSLSEGGHRVPFVLRWPGVIPSNTWSKMNFNFYDLLPTLAGFAGVDIKNISIDGIDKSMALMNKKAAPKASQYMEYCHPNEYVDGFGQLVRRGDLVFLCLGPEPTSFDQVPTCSEPSYLRVFNLSNDIGQVRPLSPTEYDTNEAWSALQTMSTSHMQGNYCNEAFSQRERLPGGMLQVGAYA